MSNLALIMDCNGPGAGLDCLLANIHLAPLGGATTHVVRWEDAESMDIASLVHTLHLKGPPPVHEGPAHGLEHLTSLSSDLSRLGALKQACKELRGQHAAVLPMDLTTAALFKAMRLLEEHGGLFRKPREVALIRDTIRQVLEHKTDRSALDCMLGLIRDPARPPLPKPYRRPHRRVDDPLKRRRVVPKATPACAPERQAAGSQAGPSTAAGSQAGPSTAAGSQAGPSPVAGSQGRPSTAVWPMAGDDSLRSPSYDDSLGGPAAAWPSAWSPLGDSPAASRSAVGE